MKSLIIATVLFGSVSVQASFDMSKIVKWLGGSYKNVRSAEFQCPDNLKKFFSKELTETSHKYYNVGCEDVDKTKYGLLFIGDILVAIQHTDEDKFEHCKSKDAFVKKFTSAGWLGYKYNVASNFEQQYIFFGADYVENKKHFLMTGVCTKHKFFGFFKRRLGPSLHYFSDSFINK